MALANKWAGRAWGTNVGNVFLTLEGEDEALVGTLRMNEPGVGVAVYAVQGNFVPPTLTLTGTPTEVLEDAELGLLTASGTMNAKGEFNGDWESNVGTAGTFVLYPHTGQEQTARIQAEQLHTARYHFGAIEIDRDQIVEIAEDLRKEFPSVVVTVEVGTEQARYLDDFKGTQFGTNKAKTIKIYASKPDVSSLNLVASVEFGPEINLAMTQGANESWVLGRLETLKRDIKSFERAYITNFKRWGIGINQMMLLGALTFLPSLNGLRERVILMGGVLGLIIAVNWLHTRYVPFAAIYLGPKKAGVLQRLWPSIASWVIGIVAAVIAAVLAAYLQGWLQIPTFQASPPSAQP